MTRVKGYIIHLARATDRRPLVDALLQALPVPSEVFDAVDARAVGEKALRSHVAPKALFEPAYPFGLNLGEIGCFLSHRAVWQKIVDEGLDFGFVAEDDLGLLPGFDKALDFALRHAGTGDFVSFQTRPLSGQNYVVKEENSFQLLLPKTPPLRTSGQLVGALAARRLLEITGRIDRPIDVFLQAAWWTRQQITLMAPSLVEDRSHKDAASTVQVKKKSPFSEFMRSIRRIKYRRSVAKQESQF